MVFLLPYLQIQSLLCICIITSQTREKQILSRNYRKNYISASIGRIWKKKVTEITKNTKKRNDGNSSSLIAVRHLEIPCANADLIRYNIKKKKIIFGLSRWWYTVILFNFAWNQVQVNGKVHPFWSQITEQNISSFRDSSSAPTTDFNRNFIFKEQRLLSELIQYQHPTITQAEI